tara:strand:- start:1052 stop:1237 length:186 start_codon:yes stop_codon:yes gene_type:complete
MYFQKKTSTGMFSGIGRLLIKIVLVLLVLLVGIVLVDKIDFPYPNKKIEKVVPNEKFKILK